MGEFDQGDSRHLFQIGTIVARDGTIEPGDAGGNRGNGVLVEAPVHQAKEHLVEGYARLSLQGHRIVQVRLGDSNGVHDDEAVLHLGVAGHDFQIVGLDDPHSPPLHLLEVVAGVHHSHEHDTFKRLHVGAGGDHVDGYRDPKRRGCLEVFEKLVGIVSCRARLVGDLGGAIVAPAELFAHDLDNVVGVGVVFCKDEGLGHPGPTGEDLGEEGVPECLDDCTDLVLGDNPAVEVSTCVGDVLVDFLVTGFTSLTGAELGDESGIHL